MEELLGKAPTGTGGIGSRRSCRARGDIRARGALGPWHKGHPRVRLARHSVQNRPSAAERDKSPSQSYWFPQKPHRLSQEFWQRTDLVCAPVSNLKSSYSCHSQRPPLARVVCTAGSPDRCGHLRRTSDSPSVLVQPMVQPKPTTASTQPRGAASLSRGACPQQGQQLLTFPNQNQSWRD